MNAADFLTIAQDSRGTVFGLHPDAIREVQGLPGTPMAAGATVVVRITHRDLVLQSWPELPRGRVVVVAKRAALVEGVGTQEADPRD